MLKRPSNKLFPALLPFLILIFGCDVHAGPVDHVSFQTDEGTWMSLDVAPDGQSLLFELLGDIYSLPIGGGKATALITGNSFDSQPRYSADGSQIVFISDRSGEDNIWLADGRGRVIRQLSEEASAELFSPAWSADGQSVLVSRISPRRSGSNSVELWQYPLDNSQAPIKIELPKSGSNSQLVSAIPAGPFGAAVSPDGSSIYFTAPSPRQHLSTAGPTAQIMRYDTASSATEVVTFEREGAFRPGISPDGEWLAFGMRQAHQNGLRIRNLVSGEERWMAYPIGRPALEDRASRDILPNFSFTPDGSAVVIAYGGKIRRIDVASGQNSLIPFQADVSLDVTPRLEFATKLDEGPVQARVIQGTQPSPDGKQFAFSAFARIYVMVAAGGTPRRLTESWAGGAFQPAWSPDGQWLAYVTWDGNQGGQVWRVRAGGGQPPEQVSMRAAYYRNPVWTADGQHILAITAPSDVRRIGGHFDQQLAAAEQIVQFTVAGTKAGHNSGKDGQRIAAAAGTTSMSIGADPERFYSYSMAGGLISRRLDGSDSTLHARIMGIDRNGIPAMAQNVRISPDGKQALALVAGQVFLVDIADLSADSSPASSAASSAARPPINVYLDAPGHRKLTTIGADQMAWAQGGDMVTWTAGATIFTQVGEATQNFAAVVTAPRRTPEGSLLLQGGRVITMHGDEVIELADVLVNGGRIAGVGPKDSLDIPRDTRVIDVTGKTIMPGIVDIHSHFIDIKRGVLSTKDYSAWASLAYGITSIRDPQSFDADIFVYSDLVAAGEMVGPRIFSTGAGVFFLE